MNKLISTNPSRNYQQIGTVNESSDDDIKLAVAKAHTAKKNWRDIGVAKRIEYLRQVVKDFEANKDKIMSLQAEEMGMPLKETGEDFDFSMEYLNSYLDTAELHLKPIVTVDTDEEIHIVVREPYGVAACIVPWNFPLANFVWGCGQNLVAGNVIVFKHSEETPLCGQLIAEVVTKALPDGVFQEVYGGGSVGERLVNSNINLICFTGSTKTGSRINELASKRFIPTSMELGGSAPGLVFEDCDIEDVAEHIFTQRYMNCGQMCDGLKRLIVHESKLNEIKKVLIDIANSKKVGDALNEETDIGPLVAKRQLELLEEQVQDAVAKGAKVLIGGKRPEGLRGAYYEPTIIEKVLTICVFGKKKCLALFYQ